MLGIAWRPYLKGLLTSQLCSHEKDVNKELYYVFGCLLDGGYQSKNMIPLFLMPWRMLRNIWHKVKPTAINFKRRKMEPQDSKSSTIFGNI